LRYSSFPNGRSTRRFIREIVLPQNRSAYDTTLSAYSAGSASFLDPLDAERALIAVRPEFDSARRDLSRTLVRQTAVTGRLPAAR
jgi:outer membrane protein TolC